MMEQITERMTERMMERMTELSSKIIPTLARSPVEQKFDKADTQKRGTPALRIGQETLGWIGGLFCELTIQPKQKYELLVRDYC